MTEKHSDFTAAALGMTKRRSSRRMRFAFISMKAAIGSLKIYGWNRYGRLHRERVRQALHWIYECLDPETRQTEQVSIQFPQVYYPGPTEQRRTTISPLLPRQPLNIVGPPQFDTKSRAIHAAKLAIKARLRRLRLSEEC
ncbi:hypothetical protein IW261DRAFT_1572599 [Armillaria novae-zelandiae]|uniref:Uncharacterized protein n=1 Tax=Armillaria novae-zelandiae TaxID=153914 RepID=A0AA39U571_9AGAR|nr:hypothetical protein IW261DRAFT_1572599 [Armillaria novae-zelandiae]